MTNIDLADDYFKRAQIRLKALYFFKQEKGYAEVVREAQELVEMVLKGVLRKIGVEPPHWHEVSSILEQHKNKLPKKISNQLKKISEISKKLRKERELAYYGDEDYIPSEEYDEKDAIEAITDCDWLITLLKSFFNKK